MTTNGSAFLVPGHAVKHAGAWRSPRPRRRVFPGHASQVSHARRFVLRALTGCKRADDAALLTSELATNAIRHTRSGEDGSFAIMLLWRPHAVIVAVTDAGAPTIPALRPTELLTAGGRGLSLVDALATQWGFHGNHDGRTVWFELDCPVSA
jgi:serine/threonine-protein kinase RsbW